MSQRKITPTSQIARDEARKLLEECVQGFFENRDEAKAMSLVRKAQLCIEDAKSIEKNDQAKGLN